MDLLSAFMSQGMIAQLGEIVLFANTITMSMPSQDMAKIFNKKIKTHFPILFKRAVEFQTLKAKGRI